MRYCVHIQLQHFGGSRVEKVDNLKVAKALFADAVYDSRGWHDTEACSATVYSTDGECECDSHMNFHDYPVDLYEIGPRGGIRRQYV